VAQEVVAAGTMGAGHFIYIPAVLFLGLVVGWLLGSRAARDAYAMELKKRDEREKRRRKEPVNGE
jgi:hypothetical protein